jgi:hypothetical protein
VSVAPWKPGAPGPVALDPPVLVGGHALAGELAPEEACRFDQDDPPAGLEEFEGGADAAAAPARDADLGACFVRRCHFTAPAKS